MIETTLQKRIDDVIGSAPVMLFMKGNPEAPQCWFSAKACEILIESGIYFESFDIMSDEELRQGLKEYKQWPTFPQLYIEGELLGGVDIMIEMYEAGEFKEIAENIQG